jgi:hypothetical protein
MRQQHGRQLIAKRFAGAGGKDRRRRTAGQHRRNRCFLTGPEGPESEGAFEGIEHGGSPFLTIDGLFILGESFVGIFQLCERNFS